MPLMEKTPHVGIIGAGIAGLRCADILIQNGVRVTIIEARDRIGGRVCQSEIGGHLVDLGPNWIHGTLDNPISKIGVLSNTTTHDWDGRQSIFDTAGNLYDEKTATKISDFVWTTLDEAFEHSNRFKDEIPADKSLLDFFKERVAQTNFTQAEKDACIESSKMWGSYVGDPIDRQSLKFFCLEECIDENNLFVASTYRNILNHISRAVLGRADIRLNEPVIGIEANPRKPGVDHQVTVTTKTGDSYSFDEVVVTCPLGWLKRNKEAFSPALPSRLLSAIDSISYGRLEKVYVTFPRAFWHTQPRASLPDMDSGKANGMHEVFNGKGPSSNPPAFAQFLNPTYVEHPEDISWNQESISLADLPDGCNHPTLLFYTYGPCATHIVSQITGLDPSSEKLYHILNEFLLPYYSRLPNYSPSSPDCKPSAFLATQWQNDPYAGNGSYSNFQVGLEQGDKDIETFRAGVGAERGVWFAGEHTAPFVDLGTTAGAYWSGERAAGQICDVYGLPKAGLDLKRDDSLPSAVALGVVKGFHTGPLTALVTKE
ncbi:hypothetical protein DTO166G4_4034 [Paecilomyces variotii]|nr:hypothetical protein DTO166G4_4034 [Paecilomyces variotii]KAJ9234825.1 hypothetical protein DTO166G5_4910 [Paecilomyces variotii]KAJ9266185.1 hypothetical protein DTO195F2_1300 [Paecilomyces variotii]KAJ9372599.1 hypothetical protein DTO282E5_2632 [Paecilomyces variotii]